MTNAHRQTERLRPEFLIGDRVRKAREVADMSQADLAKSLGINRNKLSAMEKNEFSPSLDQVRTISDVTGVDYNWLLLDQSASTSRYLSRGKRLTPTGRLVFAV